MCGLAGFLLAPGQRPLDPAGVLRDMASAIRHRGPDSAGEWFEPQSGIGLCHRRLSIIDLSPMGAQPMRSACGRYTVVFNGEIYNFEELRARLEQQGRAPAWRGRSDTEVLLAGIAAWGVESALRAFNGMFAFALWDAQERDLTLARDRVGEKPLYYGLVEGNFVFGSELKALRAFPGFEPAIDRGALALYLRHVYVPTPHTIFERVWKLPPGSFLRLSAARRADPPPAPTAYWRAIDAFCAAKRRQPFSSLEETVDHLRDVLSRAVAARLVSDVPVGAFLSGGLDSTLIVALAQEQSARPVKTFTIGFESPGYDEATHAAAIARRLGADHTELHVSAADALAVIPHLPDMYDEPFADSSQIPTFLVSRLARSSVAVALTGDAGDELFGGYNRYFLTERWWPRLRALPAPARAVLAAALDSAPAGAVESIARALSLEARLPILAEKLRKTARALRADDLDDLYRGFVSTWTAPERAIVGSAGEPSTLLSATRADADLGDPVERMMLLDFASYLTDDILAKVDRAAMSVSLETRIPYLDPEVMEAAWRTPLAFKVANGVGKLPLRRLLDRYVPPRMMDRPKMGFGVPIVDWLRGPLRPWCEALLSESRLRADGYFVPSTIHEVWRRHLSGRENLQHQIWPILMFNAWLDKERERRAETRAGALA